MRTTLLIALLTLSGCFLKKPPETAPVTGAEAAASGAATATADGGTAADGSALAQPPVVTEEQKAIARREKAREASALLTTGKFEDARRAQTLLKELEAELPESAEVAYNLGLAQEIIGNRAMAEQSYRRATQLDPELGAAWLALGSVAEAGGDLNYALQVYGQGMRAAPEDMDLRVASIGAMIKQGRLADAEAAAKKALGINANAQAIYANLALVYIQQGKLELGTFIINRAFNFVEGAKDNAHLHAYLGRIQYLQDHPFAARESYEKALELDPELLDAMIFLSEVHLDNRAYGAMVPLLEKAVRVAEDDPALHLSLGIGYRGLERYEEAEKEYRKAIELAPGTPEPYLNLAILYGDHQKRYEEAVQILAQYKTMVNADGALADAWVAGYEEEQERAQKAEERRRKREERQRKKEEEQRFLEEFERQQKEKEAAEAAAAAAAAAAQPAPAPEAQPGTEAQPAPEGEPAPPVEGDSPADGTAPAAPVSEPADSTPEPAAPSQPEPGSGAEDAAGEQGDGAEPTPSSESPWGA